jgi:hypothetical protein
MQEWVPRIVVGAIGAYLLLGGAEHYRRALLLAGFAAGVGFATHALHREAIVGPTAWAIAFVIGALAALLFSVAERVAVALSAPRSSRRSVRLSLRSSRGSNRGSSPPWPVSSGSS